MTRINGGRLAWVLGTLGLLVGCSGTYQVGMDPANSSGAGGSGAGSTPPSKGGSSSTVGGSIGDDNNASGDAGDTSGSGVAGAPGLSYCGVAYTMVPAPAFASPEQVWKRLQLFLNPSQTSPPMLPAATSRQWAGDLAMAMLDALGNDSAPGMERFVSSWLPGTPIASTWAAFFSVKGATVTDLLTTNLVRNPGSGVLTDDAVLSLGGPIQIPARGQFLRMHLLCSPVPPPPPGVPEAPSAMPKETRRQVLEQGIAAPVCASCHSLMNPLGFALEHFDSVGAYSTTDNGSPIDSSGSLQLSAGTISFDGANQLGAKLATQCEVAQCLAQQLLADAEGSAALSAAPKSPMADSANPDMVAPIAAAFAVSKGDLRTLIREIVQSDTFLRAP